MTENNSRLLEYISRDPSYDESIVRVRAARDTAMLLRKMREDADLTQEEISKKLDVSQNYILQVESGLLDYLVPIDFVHLYAEACGSDTSSLASEGGESHLEQGSASSHLTRSLVILGARALDREALAQALIIRNIGMHVVGFKSLEEWKSHPVNYPTSSAIMLHLTGRSITNEFIAQEVKIVSDFKTAPIIVLSDTDELSQVLAALKAGARGFVPSYVSIDVCIEAIKLALAGGIYVPYSTMKSVAEHISNERGSIFTQRQADVVRALRQGKSDKVIAYELNLTESAVKVHVRNIMRKLRGRDGVYTDLLRILNLGEGKRQ